eukprot:gene6197-6912_t
MALKLMLIVLLGLTAVYAVPAPEYDDEDNADLEDLANSVENEPSEDEEEEAMEDESEDEEDPKKKSKHYTTWNNKSKSLCICKRAAKKGDEPMTQDELDEGLAENAPKMTRAQKKAAIKMAIFKLIAPYFKAVNRYCHCTKEKRVISLLYYHNMWEKTTKAASRYARIINYLIKSLKKTSG